MAQSLADILDYHTLLGSIEAVKGEIPNVLPDQFYSMTETVAGDAAEWVQFKGTRQTAKRVEYGAPARNTRLRDVEDRTAKCVHTFEEIKFGTKTLTQLRKHDDWAQQQKGRDTITFQVEEFAKRCVNLRVATTMQCLRKGKYSFDSNGNLLNVDTGPTVDYTVEMRVPTTHQGDLNDPARGGAIVTANWSLATTNIPLQIRNVINRSLRVSGYEVDCAIYGKNVPTYVTENDFCKDFLARDERKRDDFIGTGEIQSGLFDISDWIPASKAFYDDENDANVDLWDDDLVVFLPKIQQDGRQWWGMLEGEFPIPKNLNVGPGTAAILDDIELVAGMGAYGLVDDNPVALRVRAFDTFLPVLRNPNVVFQMNTTGA